MARITVEDCLEVVDNRFELVMMAAKRARQLANGVEPLVDNSEDGDKPTVVALREIAEATVLPDVLEERIVSGLQKVKEGAPAKATPWKPAAPATGKPAPAAQPE